MTINYINPPLDQSSLEAAAAATADWPPHCGYYSAVYYNLETGTVWTTDESDSSLGSGGDTILCVLRTTRKASIKSIRVAIAERLEIEREAQAILAERGQSL